MKGNHAKEEGFIQCPKNLFLCRMSRYTGGHGRHFNCDWQTDVKELLKSNGLRDVCDMHYVDILAIIEHQAEKCSVPTNF